MIVFLVVIGLLIAAVLYGIFFLLFKLIWVLCKKQRNFWPLILAGAATLLVIVGVVWAAASTVNRYVVPFTPIIQAAQTRTEPVYGAQAYTDPRFGFGLTLYDGTVFSDWINLPDNGPSLLVGVDTNVFVTNSMQEDNTPLAAYLLVRAEELEAVIEKLTRECGIFDFEVNKADLSEIFRYFVLNEKDLRAETH